MPCFLENIIRDIWWGLPWLTVTNDEWKGYVSLAYKERISTFDFKFECGQNYRNDYWLSTYEIFLDNPTQQFIQYVRLMRYVMKLLLTIYCEGFHFKILGLSCRNFHQHD